MPRITILLLVCHWASGAAPFADRRHFSKVFGQPRNYRIFLPPSYELSGKSYPVIYYFHGHSDRYTLERYDNGADTVPKIAAWVANHDAIVVAVDGYVARDYTGFYGGSPWDVRREGGDYDFGEYFLELVAHIDSSYRTLTSRRHRATSGLSMGGFMSLWLSARYPDWIGSASAFNPGPEFYTGDKGRRLLWRPKDHVANHEQTMVRLVRASGDYISQYHELTRDAYARHHKVDFEFRQDEYHRHWATSIGETFDFHGRAFARSNLDNVPVEFTHTNPYRRFTVWNWTVECEGEEAGFTLLEKVSQGALTIRTRRWAPDGPAVGSRVIRVTTAPLYQAGARYTLLDYSLATGRLSRQTVEADAEGRLRFSVDGLGHVVSFAGAGTGGEPPVALPLTGKQRLLVFPERDTALPLTLYNPRDSVQTGITAEISSSYPTVRILSGKAVVKQLGAGEAVDLSPQLGIRLTAGDGDFALTRLKLKITYDDWHTVTEDVDIDAVPGVLAKPAGIEILDGRSVKLPVFRQQGNRGGGSILGRELREGKGNGNGILEPGEQATIWVKVEQGLDPFDKNTWHRAKVYTESPHLREVARLEETKQREWTSAQELTSVVELDANCPRGVAIPVVLSNESWSFSWTPDVRYGAEPLYQPFQRHRNHLHQFTILVK
jgi:pimeloyl-ACP methyl ester carboxylesterase